jgi:hypothetical protein
MRVRVGLAYSESEVNATVFDLVGCITVAQDRQSVIDVLPVAIGEHVGWLSLHGEKVAVDPEFDVTEEVDVSQSDAADGEFVFQADCEPIADEEVETAIRVMNYATGDLLSTIDSLPDPVLDWRPPESAMAKIDEWQPGVKTIREIASELPAGERYYRLGLCEGPEPDEPEMEWYDRTLQRERTVERLRSLSQAERSKVFYVTRSWQDRSEHWTVRKTIRRIISHERFHTKEIQQRLSWILLGVPEFRTPVGASIGEGALNA